MCYLVERRAAPGEHVSAWGPIAIMFVLLFAAATIRTAVVLLAASPPVPTAVSTRMMKNATRGRIAITVRIHPTVH